MLTILGTTSNAAQNITTMKFTTAFSAPANGLYQGSLRVSGMNGAGANLTVWIRHQTSGAVKIRDVLVVNALAKLTAADTVWGLDVQNLVVKAGEQLQIGVLSSNANDTSVTLGVDWYDLNRQTTPN
jgi:hypothetical protein